MRLIVSIAATTLLAGCSTVSAVRDAWTWDPTRMQPGTRVVLAPADSSASTSRLADLQLRRNDVRARISAEPDMRARQRWYEELHQIGRQLSPLERQLTAAAPTR